MGDGIDEAVTEINDLVRDAALVDTVADTVVVARELKVLGEVVEKRVFAVNYAFAEILLGSALNAG